MGEYPVVGPVPISIAAQAEPPHLMWEASVVALIVGWGNPQWVSRAQEFWAAPPPKKEANRRGQGDPSG